MASIIRGGAGHSAADAYECGYRLKELERRAAREWARMDVLLLPTTGTIYTLAEIEGDPVGLNSNLGLYTHFVNLMDLAAVAVPAGFRPQRTAVRRVSHRARRSPTGRSWRWHTGSRTARRHRQMRLPDACWWRWWAPISAVSRSTINSRSAGRDSCARAEPRRTIDCSRCPAPCRRSPDCCAIPGFAGDGIEVELWALPEHQFGGFVAAIPPPLTIGTVVLEDGACVKGFLCESAALICGGGDHALRRLDWLPALAAYSKSQPSYS